MVLHLNECEFLLADYQPYQERHPPNQPQPSQALNPRVRIRRSLANIRTNRRRRTVRKPQVPHGAVQCVPLGAGAVVQLDGVFVLHRAALDAQANLVVGDGRDPGGEACCQKLTPSSERVCTPQIEG